MRCITRFWQSELLLKVITVNTCILFTHVWTTRLTSRISLLPLFWWLCVLCDSGNTSVTPNNLIHSVPFAPAFWCATEIALLLSKLDATKLQIHWHALKIYLLWYLRVQCSKSQYYTAYYWWIVWYVLRVRNKAKAPKGITADSADNCELAIGNN